MANAPGRYYIDRIEGLLLALDPRTETVLARWDGHASTLLMPRLEQRLKELQEPPAPGPPDGAR